MVTVRRTVTEAIDERIREIVAEEDARLVRKIKLDEKREKEMIQIEERFREWFEETTDLLLPDEMLIVVKFGSHMHIEAYRVYLCLDPIPNTENGCFVMLNRYVRMSGDIMVVQQNPRPRLGYHLWHGMFEGWAFCDTDDFVEAAYFAQHGKKVGR